MDEQRKNTADSTYSGIKSQGQFNTGHASASSAGYGLSQNNYDNESLEVHQPGQPNTLDAPPEYSVSNKLTTKLAFSRRKAMIVSACITILVTLLTGISILFLARHSPKKANVQKT